MTSGEWMVQNSSLDIATAGEHLVNPECVGEGGLTVNTELILIKEDDNIVVGVVDDIIPIIKEPITLISVKSDIIVIGEVKLGEINVVC